MMMKVSETVLLLVVGVLQFNSTPGSNYTAAKMASRTNTIRTDSLFCNMGYYRLHKQLLEKHYFEQKCRPPHACCFSNQLSNHSTNAHNYSTRSTQRPILDTIKLITNTTPYYIPPPSNSHSDRTLSIFQFLHPLVSMSYFIQSCLCVNEIKYNVFSHAYSSLGTA
jgi:hypothetical protein